MTNMWQLSLPWEFIVRALIVYGFLVVLLRMTGQAAGRPTRASFDLVLLLVLSNAVQNAMNGGDNSVLAGILSACTLVLVNYLVGLAAYRNKKVEALIEGRPEVLIHNGRLFEEVLVREKLTHHELKAALRAAGCNDVADVHCAILENNGQISGRRQKRRGGNNNHSAPLN